MPYSRILYLQLLGPSLGRVAAYALLWTALFAVCNTLLVLLAGTGLVDKTGDCVIIHGLR